MCYELIEKKWWLKFHEMVSVYVDMFNGNIMIERTYYGLNRMDRRRSFHVLEKTSIYDGFHLEHVLSHIEEKRMV